MENAFHFTVVNTFQIEGRGLIVEPFFPVDEFQMELSEKIQITRPDSSKIQTIARFEITSAGRPRTIQAICVLPGKKKSEVPIGSEIVFLEKSDEQIRRHHV